MPSLGRSSVRRAKAAPGIGSLGTPQRRGTQRGGGEVDRPSWRAAGAAASKLGGQSSYATGAVNIRSARLASDRHQHLGTRVREIPEPSRHPAHLQAHNGDAAYHESAPYIAGAGHNAAAQADGLASLMALAHTQRPATLRPARHSQAAMPIASSAGHAATAERHPPVGLLDREWQATPDFDAAPPPVRPPGHRNRASQTRARRRSRAWRIVLTPIVVALVIALLAVAVNVHAVRMPNGTMRVLVGWPGIRYLIYAVWMVPIIELALLAVGHIFYRYRFRVARPGTFRLLIIQVTTTGREQDRVNEVIHQIRGYRLRMPHEIWVVTEPGQDDCYPEADRVLRVPAKFSAKSERKARALEYSRRARISLGLAVRDVKILFNDDDVAPTKGYIETAFTADYDVCEGITAPRAQYAVRPLGHFLASHADDMRTHACLVYCSVFQGIIGRPLHVHGEGLTVTGEAESIVTWDWPAFASEDLVFGQKAARAGLQWGWFHEYAELTSPWTVRDYITQRRRWLWGDIHGILHREVMSWPSAFMILGKYVFGLTTLLFSAVGLYMRLGGQLPGASPIYDVAKLSTVAWLAVFFSCGWIGASSGVSFRNNDSRLLNAVTAVIMAPVSIMLTLAGIFVPLVQGNPRTFQVISKTRRGQR